MLEAQSPVTPKRKRYPSIKKLQENDRKREIRQVEARMAGFRRALIQRPTRKAFLYREFDPKQFSALKGFTLFIAGFSIFLSDDYFEECDDELRNLCKPYSRHLIGLLEKFDEVFFEPHLLEQIEEFFEIVDEYEFTPISDHLRAKLVEGKVYAKMMSGIDEEPVDK